MTCAECGKQLVRDEIGMTRKLINRGATRFLCYACLARKFRLTVPALEEMAEGFREAGCTLFC